MLVYTPREQMKDTQEARLDQSVTYHIHVDMTLERVNKIYALRRFSAKWMRRRARAERDTYGVRRR